MIDYYLTNKNKKYKIYRYDTTYGTRVSFSTQSDELIYHLPILKIDHVCSGSTEDLPRHPTDQT